MADIVSQHTLSIEKFRCSICKNYLSCSPICSMQDGSSICGKCALTQSALIKHREIALEAVLKIFWFPCCYKKDGCKEIKKFDQVQKHEDVCQYKLCECPLVNDECLWKGPRKGLINHLKFKHTAMLLKDSPHFEINIDKNCEGKFFILNDAVFVLKYNYVSNTQILNYQLAYFEMEFVTEVNYNVRLTSSSNHNCYIIVEQRECNLYTNESFGDLVNQREINLKQILFLWGNPEVIIVSVNLNVILSNTKFVVDNKYLQQRVRCLKCKEQLVSQAFIYNDEFYCIDCGKEDSKFVIGMIISNEQLLRLANYKCRWWNCNFIGKYTNLITHENSCEYQMFECPLDNCNDNYSFNKAIEHLNKKHGKSCMENVLSFNVTVPNNLRDFCYIFKDKTLILLEYEVDHLTLCVSLFCQGPLKQNSYLQFKHKHCQLESEPIIFNDAICVSISTDLLTCLQYNDDLCFTLYFM